MSPTAKSGVRHAILSANHAAEVANAFRRWSARTKILGAVFLSSVCAVIPFLAGHSLHQHWNNLGKYVLLTAMVLLPAFLCCAGMTYALWRYLQALKTIDRPTSGQK